MAHNKMEKRLDDILVQNLHSPVRKEGLWSSETLGGTQPVATQLNTKKTTL